MGDVVAGVFDGGNDCGAVSASDGDGLGIDVHLDASDATEPLHCSLDRGFAVAARNLGHGEGGGY